ncbi:aspartic peptidase domain-containing protein [Daldinia vernicosa]|uniref:aspartic peptidase domain-containing protein n=1 Tax=Daldinia vernicosa TaxID=114800 RepID=UPI0020088275|nr:aspartic peptidase domain-containing protein [Daldinia vernicosa]KAI0852101.1 aspartic peptidase domain-containing protein [Daldinia vernicosa]
MSSKRSDYPAIRNRDNNYHVDTAVKPSVSNAVGIDQDGTDYSYFIEAAFGSEGKKMYMLVDTGASTTWVMGSGCTTGACTKHNTFGPNDSKTYKDTGEGYSVQYGSGEVSGHVVSDSISIAGLEVTMPFGVANVTSDQFSQFPFEGILGLSMVDGTWLTHLKDAKLIDSNVFGIALNRKADGVNDGEVAFGAPNKAKYTGDISYTGLKSGNSWAIPMDDVLFGGNSAGVKGRLAYIDTGTTFVFGPPDDVAALYKLIPGSKTIDKGETYTVPCDTDGEVAFSFSGKTYTASSKDFITAPNTAGTCFGSVYGMEFVPGAWLIGDMFLKNVYSVFDMDQKQIGFAARAASGSGTSSSAGPSGTSTASPSGSSTSGSATATAASAGSSSTGSPSDGCRRDNTMAKATTHSSNREQTRNTNPTEAPANEEQHGLLAGTASDEDEDGNENGIIVYPSNGDLDAPPSSIRTPGTPRTPNRVRFDLRPTNIPPPANGHDRPASPVDYFDIAEPDSPIYDDSTPRHPLLTDIEAPSIALANSLDDDVHEWAERERTRPKSGMRSAFMNMANSIIGAGIIGQPYAFKDAGLLAGIVLLISLTIIVDWTIRLIVINSKLSGANSFQGTVEHCFGKPGLVAISIAQWAFAFGGMIAFGIIVGDSIPQVLRTIWPGLSSTPVLWLLADRRAVICFFILGISYPLTLYRDIAKLAKASTFALISMGIILVTVVVQSVLTPAENRGSFTLPLLTINDGIFQAVGVISFAFVCQHNSLLIYGSLKTPTIDRFAKVTHYSTGISMLACMTMALAGFLTFGDKTLGNVLNNFPADNTMVTIARLCFGLNMLTTLPLEAFVCREVMMNYWFPNEPFNMNLHLIFSSALVVSAMTLSLLTCDLGVVFELVGATSACALAYILPPLCYIKLSSRSWKTYVAMGVVAFGCSVMAGVNHPSASKASYRIVVLGFFNLGAKGGKLHIAYSSPLFNDASPQSPVGIERVAR